MIITQMTRHLPLWNFQWLFVSVCLIIALTPFSLSLLLVSARFAPLPPLWKWCHWFIETEWRIYASGNYTITGPDNSLSPGRRQAIIWTNAGILLIGHLGTNFGDFFIEIKAFSLTNLYLNVSSAKAAAILSRPQCVNVKWHVSAWSLVMVAGWVVANYSSIDNAYRQTSSIRGTKSKNVLQLSLRNPLKPGVKSRMTV